MHHFADGKTAIHISDVTSYKTCKRAWNWTSRLRENLQPRRIYEPFFLGSTVHYAMERYYAGETNVDAVISRYAEEKRAQIRELRLPMYAQDLMEIDEIETLARAMMHNYLLWEARQTGPFSFQNLEFVTLEQEFQVPIWNPFTGEIHPTAFFEGKVDGLARRRDNGDIYIWETKTTRSIPGRVAMLMNDDQATEYLNAMRHVLGEQVKGVLYTIMAKRTPPFPKILRDGTLSKDIKNQTVWSYMQAIKYHHGDEAREWMRGHYANEIVALNESEDLYFQRRVISRTQHALDLGMYELWHVATDMMNDSVPYATQSQHCNYCTMREPCLALQNGQDHQEILADSFESRSVASEVVEVEDD